MAKLIPSPMGDGPLNDFEALVVEVLLEALPDGYLIVPNFEIRQNHDAFEMDVVVFAPHAVYVVEAKNWIGQLTGDDSEWLINNRIAKKCPLWLANRKAKVLKSLLTPVMGAGRVVPVLVVPTGTSIMVGGSWADHAVTLAGLSRFLRDPRIAAAAPGLDLTPKHADFVTTIQGSWGRRRRGPLGQVGSYVIAETLAVDDEHAEYLAKHAFLGDQASYRLRVWHRPPELSEAETRSWLARVRRPSEAVHAIGPHPNLLAVRAFDMLDDGDGFYEVTEWSEHGTLHGYLKNLARDPLTIQEKLDIAIGVCRALLAIHRHQVVHRNLCPEAILLDYERKPRLTDFDRAYLGKPGAQTVFALTKARNPAYVPPELEDVTDYDFTEAADLYAFGVLLYELFVGQPPFETAKAARQANGLPPATPSQARPGTPAELDALVMACLQVAEWNARPTAAQALDQLVRILDDTTGRASRPGLSEPDPPAISFKPGSVIDRRIRIEAEIASGATATVYKAHHLNHGRTYAMKVMRSVDGADLAMQEYETNKLPAHPNIATIRWLDKLPPPSNQLYLLADFIEGEPLTAYCQGTKALPYGEVRKIGAALLDALTVVHGAAWLHRDIKPANILLAPGNVPVLIDFNLAAMQDEATGSGGTPRYWAPDRGKPSWSPDADLFSLGVVLYELVAHRHPFPADQPDDVAPIDPAQLGLGISTEFAAFLLKAVQPRRADRFSTAAEMRAALESVPHLHAPKPIDPPHDEGPSHAVDQNPYVEQMLTLFSQASRSNAGTRGLDDIGRRTYVQTRLDSALQPAILDGTFRLVIITGNAGDGKTAFLQQLEDAFAKNGAAVSARPAGNGAAWSHDGLDFVSNYDGSQDEGAAANDRVLMEFFAPFAGDDLKVGLGGHQVRLIAINEGRLRDFLDDAESGRRFGGLRRVVSAFFVEKAEPPPRVLIVNLNLRAVAADGDASIVEAQLTKLVDPALWAPCSPCRIAEVCPLRRNAATLGDPVTGKIPRERLRRLFEVVHLRRHQHVTMRDLRSALSWFLLQDHDCQDIAAIEDQPDAPARFRALDYTQAFAADGPPTGDRVIKLLREIDVGLVELPDLDRRLNANPAKALSWIPFEGRGPSEGAWFGGFVQAGAPAAGDGLARALAERRTWMQAWRRKAYFERLDEGVRQQVPFLALESLEAAIWAGAGSEGEDARKALKDQLVEAISLLEGVRDPALRRANICLRSTRSKGSLAHSYRLFPAAQARLRLEAAGSLDRFMETAPDAVVLVVDTDQSTAELRLALDLVEMLLWVRRGYRPGPHDMGGLFVNLAIFRNSLLQLPYKEVLVSADGERFTTIAAAIEDGQIRFTARPVATQEGGAP